MKHLEGVLTGNAIVDDIIERAGHQFFSAFHQRAERQAVLGEPSSVKYLAEFAEKVAIYGPEYERIVAVGIFLLAPARLRRRAMDAVASRRVADMAEELIHRKKLGTLPGWHGFTLHVTPATSFMSTLTDEFPLPQMRCSGNELVNCHYAHPASSDALIRSMFFPPMKTTPISSLTSVLHGAGKWFASRVAATCRVISRRRLNPPCRPS